MSYPVTAVRASLEGPRSRPPFCYPRHVARHRLRPAGTGEQAKRQVFALLLSLPDPIVTKAYAPILVVGAVGGLLLDGILDGWK